MTAKIERFDANSIYSKKDFIRIFQGILDSDPEMDGSTKSLILGNIKWAEKHADDTLFAFCPGPGGYIIPLALNVPNIPFDPPQDPELN